MKARLLFFALLCFVRLLHAQTPEEWTEQNKTQIKYLIEQIVALKGYAKLVEKGYTIVAGGLALIHDIKEGDFKLHKGYFSSLSNVNPNLHRSPKPSMIASMLSSIRQNCNEINSLTTENLLTDEEKLYLHSISAKLLTNMHQHAQELSLITTNNHWRLKDDERMERLEKLYESVFEDHTFSSNAIQQISVLHKQRILEKMDVSRL